MAENNFEAFLKAASNDGARGEIAKTSLKRLSEQGLPNRRVEAYKYTNLKSLLGDAPSLFNPKSENQTKLISAAKGKAFVKDNLIIFSGGECLNQTELTNTTTLKTLLDVPLPNINADSAQDSLFQLCGSLPITCHEITINSEDFIEIMVIAEDIEAILATRIKLVKSENIKNANIIITHIGGAGATQLSMVELSENKGEFTLIKRQLNDASCKHFDIMAFDLSGDAHSAIYQLNSGASKGRNGIYGAFSGEDTKSHLDLFGVTLAGHDDHMDTTFVLDHAVPNCTSEEIFKNVVGGNAKAVFQGKIMVNQIAQKTDAQMMCQSLLVSENAEVDVKPELEIFADDVLCGHGATMGDIDEDLLFYLRARGIGEQEARKMLMLAFLSEVFENIDDEDLKHVLQEDIEQGLQKKL